MADRCPKCGRPVYQGTTKVRPDECPHEDGIGCRAYRYGVEVGREAWARTEIAFDLSPGERGDG
jgi:hypothetical protein